MCSRLDENIVSVDDRENLIKINVSNPNGSLSKSQLPQSDVVTMEEAADDVNVDVKGASLSRKEMRRNKNLRVRINDDNAASLKKKSNRQQLKRRNCQKFVFTGVLILLLLLCIGILVYFFGKKSSKFFFFYLTGYNCLIVVILILSMEFCNGKIHVNCDA